MNDFRRYDRQVKLNEIGIEGQQKLSKAKILIIGAGGLGCPAAQYLTAAGVGTIGLMDHDKVDLTNLHRQVLYAEEDVGKSKAEQACKRLKQMNSEVELLAITERLTEKNALDLFSQYDIILDGTDNFQTKYLINDACVFAGKPFIGASIYKYQGQLSVFNYKGSPTYRCLYSNHHLKDNNNCEETGVLGVLPGILGTMQAAETLKLILDIGTSLSGKLKMIDVLGTTEQIIRFSKDEDQVNTIRSSPLTLETIYCKLKTKHLYLDVREPFEQPRPTNARLLSIPMNQLRDRIDEIPKDEEVFVFCQSGIRSKKAIQLLAGEFGFTNLVDVEGGIDSLLA
ncbi:MAG: molybdopterin-synthase adenylyltransferase MoeB [Ekhidna sp.]